MVSEPGSAARAYAALTASELRLAVRRGENLVVTIVLPAAVLVFLALVPLGPASGGGLDGVIARVLATAVVATGLVSLGIATAFERGDGALRRLTLSPAPRAAIVGARTTVVVVTVAIQATLLVALGVGLGWRPDSAGLVASLPALFAGTVAHAAAGLALAFRFQPETVLAVANGLFVVFLLAGGLIVPAASLPAPLGSVAALLPPGMLAAALHEAFRGGGIAPVTPALAAWAAALGVVAIRGVQSSRR